MDDVSTERAAVTFRRERIADAWDEALPLLRDNAAESGALPLEDFCPDRKRLEDIDALGLLRVFVARMAGCIVGYAVFLVSPHLHWSWTMWATQDVLYVSPEARGRVALRFLKWQDDELAGEGVDVVLRQVTGRKDYGRVLERMGYRADAREYVRDLRTLPPVPMCAPDHVMAGRMA